MQNQQACLHDYLDQQLLELGNVVVILCFAAVQILTGMAWPCLVVGCISCLQLLELESGAADYHSACNGLIGDCDGKCRTMKCLTDMPLSTCILQHLAALGF